ncbi:hypothetical protein K501DRAFT_284983 [Backusella circina FSU 941]|nr:hypothetical protein K501DRAFT_284983 [Backusella circina FSU 941]
MSDPKEQKEAPAPAAELDPAAAAKKAAKEAKNEEKRLAKMAKFAAKKAKLDEAKKTAVDNTNSDKKKKKAKAEPAPVYVNKTPKGEKKDLSDPIASAYDPTAVESAWYDWWVKAGLFKPQFGPDGKNKPEGTFVIPAPPPNVTGSLHIGHALTVSIQDSLIRWNRMLGKTVLFNPGTDHAGISCQSVVEKKLWKEHKQTRHDLGREKFIEKVWEWKETYGHRIHEQFHRLGASFDWDRAVFTMDEKPSKAVVENFVRLHRDGIIYRANRLVNWCVTLNTALSNLEVDNKELPGRTLMNVSGYDAKDKFEFGVLNEFAYLTEDFERFYPASMLETGWDILFFWVARMVMLGIQLTGKVPFAEVLCHAMIRDAHGRKMSKSLGNVIDPVDVIEGISLEGLHKKLQEGNLDPKEIKKAESGQKADFPKGIPQCGTDALRFALCAYTTGGRDINLDISRVEGYRKFCNKLWNATRFALMKLGDDFKPNPTAAPTGNESLTDKWILAKLNKCAIDTNKALEERNFFAATNAVYQFWLYELCDVYIEVVKPICDADTTGDEVAAAKKSTAQNTLYTCLEAGLKLMHPFMPFVTEELFQRLGRRPGQDIDSIVLAKYPVEDAAYNFPEAEKNFDVAFEVVKTIRSLAVQLNKKKDIVAYVQATEQTTADLLRSESTVIIALTKGLSDLNIVSGEAPAECESGPAGENVTVHVLK